MTTKRLFLRLLLTLPLYALAAEKHITLTPRLQTLLDDMKRYKLDSQGDRYLHAGDLYEHSLWAHHGMVELLESKTPYTEDLHLNSRMKEVVCLAALLHDIGKAGRKELFEHTHPKLYYTVVRDATNAITSITYYQDRREHPHICFCFTANPLLPSSDNSDNAYHLLKADGTLTPFDIDALYKELDLTQQEKQITAILTGIHYEFGMLREERISTPEFFNLVQNLVTKVNYNNGKLDELIVRLSVLINVADVKGLVPVDWRETPLFSIELTTSVKHDTIYASPAKKWGYLPSDSTVNPETLSGIRAFRSVMDHYKTVYKPADESSTTPAKHAFC